MLQIDIISWLLMYTVPNVLLEWTSASVFTTLAGDFLSKIQLWITGIWVTKYASVWKIINHLIKFLHDDIMNLWIDNFRCSLIVKWHNMFLERQTLQALVVHHVPSVRGFQLPPNHRSEVKHETLVMVKWMWNAMWNGEQMSEQLLKLSHRHADLFCSQAFWKQIHALLKQLQIALSSVLQKKS